MAFRVKTERQLAAHKALDTEEEQARRFLWFMGQKEVQIPAESLAGFMNFLVSVIYRSASAGIRLYAAGNVQTATCIDAENHVYTFSVKSEESDDVYHTGFSHIRRDKKRHGLELSDLKIECTCGWASWATHVKGGRIRICKHVFAAMLWLVHHSRREDLPKFRQLVNFLFFSVMWVNPSETLLKTMKKAQRKFYKGAWKVMLHSLHDRGENVPKGTVKDFISGVQEHAGEVEGGIKSFSASARQQIPAVAEMIDAIVGGREKKEYRAWFDCVCSEIFSLLGAKPADRTLNRYARAKEIQDKAAFMRRQLGAMNGIAEKYKGTEPDPLIRKALEVWAEGIRRRLREAESIEKRGLVTPELSEYVSENIEREVALVLELWDFYHAVRRMVWEMAKEDKVSALEKAFKKLKK